MAHLRADDAEADPRAGPTPVRPAVDAVAMDDVRARAERALFGAAEPARIGRYRLTGPIAGGGMGMVYRADDPELHRKVALKLLHPRQHGAGTAHQRLIVEARALAQLDHPNVVKVHDVLTHDGQVVIVMALVEGQTVAAWERAQPRTWRDVVAVYAQAGDGLAAAHALDFVHRDFKPANAIVGDDGRVRVLDFGLARFVGPTRAAPTDDDAPAGADPAAAVPVDPGLTTAGDVVGTLGFTAPEQLEGQVATAASDQFSFCVALHRAVEGVPPFAGDGPERLVTAIRTTAPARARDRRRVPPWLRAAIGRGLAADPAQRHPSMRALTDLLRRPRGWKRWRGPVALAAAAALAALAVLVIRPDPATAALATCTGHDGWIADVWSPAHRARLETRLAAPSPYAREVAGRVVGGLDRYRSDAVAMRREACLANRRGDQSDALHDRRMLCLAHRRGDLAAAVDVLGQRDDDGADGPDLDGAIEVVAGMPPVAQCADAEALQAAQPPPPSLRGRLAVIAVRAQLSQAAALERAGRSAAALAVADDALAQAGTTGYAPAAIEAALVRGRILLFAGRCPEAVPALQRAEREALASRLWPIAVEAAARRLFCASRVERADRASLQAQADIFEALSRDLPGDPFARPLLLNNLGSIDQIFDDRAAAVGHYQAARAALAGVARPDLELIAIDKNLAMLTADGPTRAALARAAWQRLHEQLGAAHPLTLDALDAYASVVPDPALARDLATTACAAYRSHHPDQRAVRAECEAFRAYLADELGDPAAATAGFTEVIALATGADDPDTTTWDALARGQVQLAGGDPAAALATFQALIDRYRDSPHWWEIRWAADAGLGAGLAEQARRRPADAIAQLERAIGRYERSIDANEEVDPRRRLARARLTLATLLRDRGDPDRRPAALEREARAFYRATGAAAYRDRLGADPGTDPTSPPPN